MTDAMPPELDLDQIAVESRVASLLNLVAELQHMRLDESLAAHILAEEINLGKALTGLQVLCSNIALTNQKPKLRVV